MPARSRRAARGERLLTALKTTKTPVVLLRAEGYASLGIVRSLGRLGVPVHCVDHDPKCLAARSRYSAGRTSWDFDANSLDASVQFLIDLADGLDARPVLLPASDELSLFVDRYSGILSTRYLFPAAGPGTAARLYNKRSLFELCCSAGVPTPETFFPTSLSEALQLSSQLRFPLVVKPIEPNRLPRGADRRMAVVRSRSELADAYRSLEGRSAANLLLQELIPHAPEDRGVISAYFDAQGECRFAVTGRKLRQLPIDGGVTTFAACSPCNTMVEQTRHLVRAVGYRGVLDADFCRDARDGQWKLLDVNPRFGANFRALVDRNGLDVVRALYLDLTGQEVPDVEPDWGRRWLVEDKDFWALREHMRERSLAPRAWLRSVWQAREFAYWSFDDPAPGIRVMAGFAAGYIRAAMKRRRRNVSGREAVQ